MSNHMITRKAYAVMNGDGQWLGTGAYRIWIKDFKRARLFGTSGGASNARVPFQSKGVHTISLVVMHKED